MAVKKGALMTGLGIAFLALGIIGISIVSGMFYATSVAKTQYGIVIDAGSSHSSMFTYSWPSESLTGGRPDVEQRHRCDVDDHGLSSYQANPSEAGPNLKMCLDEVTNNLPWAVRSHTSIYLGATAGMRLVKKKNETISREIFESVKKTIATTDLDVSYLDNRIQIITGHVEASSLWISVNSILGLLGDVTRLLRHDAMQFSNSTNADVKETIGVLDLGSASTQIAFNLTSSIDNLPDSYLMDMKLYGSNINLFTDSFLCSGMNEARSRLLSLVAQKSNYSSTLEHPCYNKGYTTMKTYDEVFESICTKVYQPSGNVTGNVTIVGTGNSTICDSMVSELFDQSKCNYTTCSFDSHPLPPLPEKLVARSGYYYTVQGLGVLDGTTVDKNLFDIAMQEWCGQTWAEAQNTYFRYPAELCANSHIVNNLLTKAYGLQSFESLMFANKIEDMDVEWTLGYIIEESYKEPKSPTLKLFDISIVWFIIVTILAVILILLGLILIIVPWCLPKYRTGYTNVRELGPTCSFSNRSLGVLQICGF